jgi:hypothetical protein
MLSSDRALFVALGFEGFDELGKHTFAKRFRVHFRLALRSAEMLDKGEYNECDAGGKDSEVNLMACMARGCLGCALPDRDEMSASVVHSLRSRNSRLFFQAGRAQRRMYGFRYQAATPNVDPSFSPDYAHFRAYELSLLSKNVVAATMVRLAIDR